MQRVAQDWLVLELTHNSGTALGLTTGLQFLPLLLFSLWGGVIADRWLGRYWTIVGFSVPYVLGHFILGLENEVALVVALALLAGGSGVIKPNISTLMGQTYDQQRPGNERLRSAAFLWFYFSINIGALISMLAMPELRDHSGYAVAFQFPAWLMLGSLAIFAAGKRHYALETFQRHELTDEERLVRTEVLQDWASKVKVGQECDIRDDSISDRRWKGRVTHVSDWFTHRRSIVQEPFQLNDVRTLECLVSVEGGAQGLRIGQRLRVTIKQGGP